MGDAVGHRHHSLQAIAVLNEKECRFLGEALFPTVAFETILHGQSRFHQIARPPAIFLRLPNRIAPHSLNRCDAGLAPFTAFEHALHSFQRMETVRLLPTVTDADGRLNFTAHW